MFKVLLVDDEQIERMALTRKIEKYYGDRVLCSQAVDGRDAIKVFQQEEQDVVIMDISMPEMNGVMAARRIREMSSDCSIIFLSAYDDFNYTRNAIKVKALDYLLKPCDKNDLLAVMDMALYLAEIRHCSYPEEAERLDSHESQAHMLQENRTQENLQEDLSRQLQENEYAAGATRKELNELAVAQRMKQYVIDNYSKDISMQEAARTMEYSDAYFSKLFKQYFNQNFTAYLTEYRIREAKRLLAETNISIKEISRMVGYFDPNYFAKIFKRLEGVIPSKYREEL